MEKTKEEILARKIDLESMLANDMPMTTIFCAVLKAMEEYGSQCRKEGFESFREKAEEEMEKQCQKSQSDILLRSEILTTIREIKQ